MTTMNNEDPADQSVHEPGVECLHPQIITYAIADQGPEHGKPAGLWACAECGRKFEPMQIAPRSAEAVAAERERQTKPPKWLTCPTHGDAQPNAWGCPECVREMRAELDAHAALIAEVFTIAQLGVLPDGDIVDTPTLLWAEEWARRLAEKEQPK